MALSSNKHIIVQHFDELRLSRACENLLSVKNRGPFLNVGGDREEPFATPADLSHRVNVWISLVLCANYL